MVKNCGHYCYGESDSFRDIDPKKWYWCGECSCVSNENCGHLEFGYSIYECVNVREIEEERQDL